MCVVKLTAAYDALHSQESLSKVEHWVSKHI